MRAGVGVFFTLAEQSLGPIERKDLITFAEVLSQHKQTLIGHFQLKAMP